MNDYVVVIPTRNRYLDCLRAVRSALGQKQPPDEVIVVDDASTDRRYEWLAEIVNDARLTMIRRPVCSQEEQLAGFAVGAVRNTALDVIYRGSGPDWVAFLDDDDEWLPTKMATQFGAAAAFKNAQVFCTNAINRRPDGRLDGTHHPRQGRQLAHDCCDVTACLAEFNPVINSSAILRARLACELGQQNPSGFGEDYDYWRRAGRRSPVIRLHESLVYYTVGNAKEYVL
jgi:glycosyltransferase involved in cell wall biosynthesis